MSPTYTTVTSKGQVTIPAEMRRGLGIEPGQKLQVSTDAGRVVIEPTTGIEQLRGRLRAEAEVNGTWGKPYHQGDGFAQMAQERAQR
ncbi:MAG: AbrB/MazE/SpoVT family DNA-binding domain-containing protein [Bifidobacteriaceae bacterium]|jgi:AbrB family looped-hinge helix DNA binding protein|nr:AbrB/MazE/SpoVT family DNA-binding domain-containing protein [Bifidobacteriaceae bacterium]